MTFTLDRSLQVNRLEVDIPVKDWPTPSEWLTLADEELQKRLAGTGAKGSESSGWYAPPRGTHGGTRTTIGAASSVAVEESIRELEERDLEENPDREVAIILSQRGEILSRVQGFAGGIPLSPEEVDMLKDAIFTHNHPSGRGFSVTDMYSAARFDLAEIRATGVAPITGQTVLYRMTRPQNGWPPSPGANTLIRQARREALSYLWNLVHTENLPEEYVTALRGHETATRYVQMVSETYSGRVVDYDVEVLQ